MKAERDIAGIVLPFVAGTAIVMYAGGVSASASSAALFSITLLLLGLLLYIRSHRISHVATWTILLLCMGICGALAASTDLLLSVSSHQEIYHLCDRPIPFRI